MKKFNWILTIFIIFAMSCTKKTYIQKLQSVNNYEYAMKQNESFTLKSIKEDLVKVKRDARKGKNVQKELERIEKVLKQIEDAKKDN